LSDVIRSACTILAAAACAATLSGCATFTDDDVVATVDGSEIDSADFDAVADDFFGRPELFGTSAPTDGRVDGEQARVLVSVLVRQQIFQDLVDDAGLDITADRADFVTLNLAGQGLDDTGDEIQELIADIDPSFQSEVLTDVPAADASELEAMYADDPLTVGLACLRHILVDTEEEADEIAGLLDDGADFATLAAERSNDEATAANGGALSSPGGDCIPLQRIAQEFEPAFAAAVLEPSGQGVIGPVESSFGWHLIVHRPWDEIADSVLVLHTDGDSGGYQLDGRLYTAEVDVSPRYGTWALVSQGGPLTHRVVALG
jgi:parvulin-like peptidyl-prolyl isomerase